jgi:hypothetical protein
MVYLIDTAPFFCVCPVYGTTIVRHTSIYLVFQYNHKINQQNTIQCVVCIFL